MKYEGHDYTSEFINAMKEWKIPSDIDKERLSKIETNLKDSLCDKKIVESYEISDDLAEEYGAGVGMSFWAGGAFQAIAFIEGIEKNETRLFWTSETLMCGDDCFLLRWTEGQPLKIYEKLTDLRQKKYDDLELW